MELKSNTHYFLEGATVEQRKEFIKLVVEDNNVGWELDVITDFIYDVSDDVVFFSFETDEWEWTYFPREGNEDFETVFVKDLNL